ELVRASTNTRAKLVLERSIDRAPSTNVLDVALPTRQTLVWKCRRGLETMLAEDLDASPGKEEVTRVAALSLGAALRTRLAIDVAIEIGLGKDPPWAALVRESSIAA